MFGGGNKIKLDKDLIERAKRVAEVAGYASHEEFITHIIEKRAGATSRTAPATRRSPRSCEGLGYIS